MTFADGIQLGPATPVAVYFKRHVMRPLFKS